MTQISYNQFYNEEYRKLYVGSETATETFFKRQKAQGRRIYNYLTKKGLLNTQPLHVLEIGCGAGGILDYFKENGHQIRGIDLGAEYVQYGIDKHELNLEVGTIKDIVIRVKPDLIIYSHVLEHVLDINAEIEAIKSVAHIDTVVYIEVPGVKQIHKNYESNILRYFQNAHTYHFTLESLVNLMHNHGFSLVEGNQFIKSTFKLSNKEFIMKSDYKAVSAYIERTEKYRIIYPLTFRGLKTSIKRFLQKILDITGTRGWVRSRMNIISKR